MPSHNMQDFALTELDFYLDNMLAVPLELIQRLAAKGYEVLSLISSKRFPQANSAENKQS